MAVVTAKMSEQTKKRVPPTHISLMDNPSAERSLRQYCNKR